MAGVHEIFGFDAESIVNLRAFAKDTFFVLGKHIYRVGVTIGQDKLRYFISTYDFQSLRPDTFLGEAP